MIEALSADDLSGFRWHTGSTLRPLAADEPCPLLFRDVGPAALALFLRGRLPRLAGPLSPLLYLRTSDYIEPYTDFEGTGRLVILQPLRLRPWHSGISKVFVARARSGVDDTIIGFVPGNAPLSAASVAIRDASNTQELRESLGGQVYDDAASESLERLDRFARELAASEVLAAPWRKRLQSRDHNTRSYTRDRITRVGLTENDLCAAWHHLPSERREFIVEMLRSLAICEVP